MSGETVASKLTQYCSLTYLISMKDLLVPLVPAMIILYTFVYMLTHYLLRKLHQTHLKKHPAKLFFYMHFALTVDNVYFFLKKELKCIFLSPSFKAI